MKTSLIKLHIPALQAGFEPERCFVLHSGIGDVLWFIRDGLTSALISGVEVRIIQGDGQPFEGIIGVNTTNCGVFPISPR